MSLVSLSGLCLAASIGVASCGQEGKVAATSGTTVTDGGDGGTGGAGGTGGSGGATAGSGGAGGSVAKQPLKVLTWNLHNLFNTTKDSAFDEEQVLSSSEYNQKLAAIGAILKELDPDVAVLPEVENKAILDDLNGDRLGGAYTTEITATNDFRGLDIGVLSKVAIDKVVTHKDDEFKRLDLAGGLAYRYSRDCVEVHIEVNGREIVLLGVHYRSKGNGMAETDDKDKRMAEAQHTRKIADDLAAEDPSRAILILGDFNDLPGSPPVNWSLQGNPKNDPKVVFAAATAGLPAGDAYTFVYNGVKELIDHQIMNPVLTPMLDESAVVIRHGSDVEDASDHFPLMVTYQVQ